MEPHHLFTFPSSLDHYTAEAFALRCFDDRFSGAFREFIRKKGFQHIDLESVAGGLKILASPEKESDQDFMLRELEKSIRLHRTRCALLFSHHDCGAYGGLARFGGDRDVELSFHLSEHEKAISIVCKRFPGLRVETYFIDGEGIVKIRPSENSKNDPKHHSRPPFSQG